jgi:hypothetical protein
LRPVSLEPVGPKGAQRGKIFLEKSPVVELPKKKEKFFATNAFLWGNFFFFHIFLRSF